MFTLTYDAPTVHGNERYATRAEAEAAAEEVRAAMINVGYGAHTDSIVITEDDAPTPAACEVDHDDPRAADYAAWCTCAADAAAAPTATAPLTTDTHRDHVAPGVRVELDTPIGAPLTARGAIGTVRGTLAGWSASSLGMRPIVSYERHGRAYRSSTFDTVNAR